MRFVLNSVPPDSNLFDIVSGCGLTNFNTCSLHVNIFQLCNVYFAGDPSRYHSFYIAVCVPYDRKLPALEIVALGRLGTGVKKTVLLCSVDDSGQVHHTSLQWSGIN
jgi:hypothetical protein